MLAPAPAPDSTITLNPSFASLGTTSGTVATRFSPGKTSRGTPITCAVCITSFLGALAAILLAGGGDYGERAGSDLAGRELERHHRGDEAEADDVEHRLRVHEKEPGRHQHRALERVGAAQEPALQAARERHDADRGGKGDERDRAPIRVAQRPHRTGQ